MGLEQAYMLTFYQTYGAGGEQGQNNYFYLKNAGAGGAIDLAELFVLNMVDPINDLQTPIMKNRLVRVINLETLTDFYETSVSGTGTNPNDTSQPMPFHDAINVTLRVNTRAIRPGSKRYSGFPESNNAAGLWTGNETEFALMLAAHSLPLIDGDGNEFRPIVVKRVPYVTPAGNDAYRLPISDAEFVYGEVTVALSNMKITTQDSRGNGR